VCTKLHEDGKDAESSHKLALAEAYIKRHEGKSRKKDHIEDKHEKVTRPNFRKYLRDKVNMKIRVTPELSEELQKICFDEGIFWTGGLKDILRDKKFLFISNTSKYIKSYNIKSESTYQLFAQHIECKEYNHETDTLAEENVGHKSVEKPTPLEIAKMIRDNGYVCLYIWNCRKQCPISNSKTGQLYCSTNRKKLIDDYISANEPKPVKTVGIDNDDVTLAKPTVKENLSVPCEHLINGDSCGNPFDHCDKDCPANSEYPDPIRLDIPDIFYCPTPQGILRFKRSQIILKDTNNDDCLLKYHEEYPCYRTLEEAVIVAKKLWNGEGK
jgi:hypothetical protein